LALLFSAAPKLHAAAHNSGADSHECLAMVLQSGVCGDSIAAPALAGFVPTVSEVPIPDHSLTVPSIFLSCQVLEHAPPALA
jgi:hypothetical protein